MKDQNSFMKLQYIFHISVAQVVCMIIYWYGLRRRNNNIHLYRTIRLEGEVVRDELLSSLLTPVHCRAVIRMSPSAFISLCSMLVKEGGLRPTLRATVEEQVAKSLYVLGHSVTNRELRLFFRRS